MVGDAGSLQLALGDDLKMRRDIVEREIAERLLLPLEPDQKLSKISLISIKSVRRQPLHAVRTAGKHPSPKQTAVAAAIHATAQQA
jgi:hypothetical protein